mgnify:CR=1 FL=1
MGIFNKLLRAGEKAEAIRTTEGSAIDRLASNKLMTGRQAIGSMLLMQVVGQLQVEY